MKEEKVNGGCLGCMLFLVSAVMTVAAITCIIALIKYAINNL
jgi:hypothetical protein